ncbi:MAG TPA: hypothetical protein VJR89_25365 [Polyangiales bacterium]|nr:hypothetical protein [Polyangiales bacterium]
MQAQLAHSLKHHPSGVAQRVYRRRQWLQAAALCSWLLATSAAADSGEYRLAVLAFESDEVQDNFAEALAQALREALDARSDYTLHQTHVSLAQLSLSQNCDISHAGCLTAIARSLKLDGFVFGKVTHEGGAPVAVLRRYDLWSEAIDRSALASFSSDAPQQPELERAAHKLLDDLLGPAPGTHRPNLAVTPATAPKLTTPRTLESKDSGPSAGVIAGYALLGGAVLTAGLSVLSFVEVERAEKDPNYERYRLAVGNSSRMNVSDVCDEAAAGRSYGLSPASFRDVKETCTRGMTYEVLQFVFLGGAVVSGGLAAFFLTTGSGGDKEKASLKTGDVSLQPSLGRRGFALNAKLKF